MAISRTTLPPCYATSSDRFGERRVELDNDLPYVHEVLARGAAHAHEVAATTYTRAADAIGLLPPG